VAGRELGVREKLTGIPIIETAGVPVGAIFIEDGREFWAGLFVPGSMLFVRKSTGKTIFEK
jgi:hypothetical protein